MQYRSLLALAFSLALAGCGSSSPPAEDGHGDHGEDHAAHHGEGHHGEGHHAGGHGHGHDHSSPEALRPLMRDLRGWMSDLRASLTAGDIAQAAGHAQAIAVACDDQDVHAFDPEAFGPRFGEIDEELHSAAAAMAAAAVADGDIEVARASYAPLLSSCVSCHAQAPSASHVVLDDLSVTEW